MVLYQLLGLVICNFLIPASSFNIATNATAKAPDRLLSEEARQYKSSPGKYLISSLGSRSSSYRKIPHIATPSYTYDTSTAATYVNEISVASSSAPSVSLGDSCTGYTDCTSIRGATCQLSVCACGLGTVSYGNIACIPVAKYLGDPCVITAQCRPLDPLATCYKDTCLCEPIYHVAGDGGSAGGQAYRVDVAGSGSQGQRASLACIPKQKLGEACTDNVQCAYQVWNSLCDSRSRTCACAAGFTPIGNTQCAPFATALGQYCGVDAQCAAILFAICGRSGTCECPDAVRYVQVQTTGSDRRKRQVHGGYANQMYEAGTSSMIGDRSDHLSINHRKTKNSDCISGVCRCVDGFVQRDPLVNECLPKIMAIGPTSPPCTISAQCMLTGTFCNQTIDRCDCNRLFCARAGECLPMVGQEQPCRDSCQCTTIGATCLNGWCQCKTFSIFSQLINMCLPQYLQTSSNLYEFTASCCGDTSRPRCVGQILLDPSTNITGPFFFSLSSPLSSPIFTIDNNGAIFLNGTPALTVTVTLSATVATAIPGQIDTAFVVVKPGACCTVAPTATSTISSVAITLITGVNNPATETMCTTTMAADAFPPLTTGIIFNSMPIAIVNLFSMPCGEINTITGTATSSLGTGAGPTTAATCIIVNGFLGISGTIVKPAAGPPSAIFSCTYTLTATGCNGLSSTLTYSIQYTCP